MQWIFNNDIPIYLQIMDHIRKEIASGNLSPGQKLPSVRELALEAGVNPNTMQKALSELERDGFLQSNRTEGRYVSNELTNTGLLKENLVNELCEVFIRDMNKIGIVPDEAIKKLEEFIKKEDICNG
ncbi:MAG: GntR family transcriptional regulator [Lachnospira sp.]